MIASLALVVASWYGLHVNIDPAHHSLSADADIRVKNDGDRPVATVPLLLYRLFDVESASGPFTQKVVKFPEEPAWQVNAVEVTLPKPLPPGETTTIHVKYGGPLLGYREVMQYVRDTVSEEYTLLRPETMPYPIVGPPTKEGWRQAYRTKFDYEVQAVVPDGYVTVCGANNCAGRGVNSIDVAIARFHVVNDAGLHVYAMPADADAGNRVMSEMRRALAFYRSYIGPEPAGDLTLIEIPDGWGSYGLPGHIFQAAATFKDPSRVNELYHEVSHIWTTVQPVERLQRARYFDEAFATYFEGLAVREFQGPDAFRDYMQRTRESFAERAASNPLGRTTPIADYGAHELGDFAYSKGAWSLHVLHQLLGEDLFRRSVSTFLRDYAGKPADFDDFRRSLEKSSGHDLHLWFDRWIANGPESSEALIAGKTVEEMVSAVR